MLSRDRLSCFALDRRSVEFFRIVLALVLLTDLVADFWQADQLYTRQGLLPRTTWAMMYENYATWSVHAALDSLAFARSLITVQIGLALALLVGFRSQVVAGLSWLLFVSMLNRNLIATDGGDQIGSYLLFIAMFLPLSGRFSVDYLQGLCPAIDRDGEEKKPINNIGTVMLVWQMTILYVFAGVAKLRNDDWWNGSAMDLILRWNEYAKPLAKFLRSPEWMSRLVTGITPWMECFMPIGFFLWGRGWWLKVLALLSFVGLHAVIHVSLSLSLFCFYPLAGLVALIPSEAWNTLERRFPKFSSSPSKKVVAPVRNSTNLIERWIRRVFEVVAILLALCSAYSAFPAVFGEERFPYGGWIQTTNDVTFGWQNWNLFRNPPHLSGGYRACGTTIDGRKLDLLLHGQNFAKSKPDLPTDSFPSRRWLSFMMRAHALWNQAFLRNRVAAVIAEDWNSDASPQDRVDSVSVVYFPEKHEPFSGNTPQEAYVYGFWRAPTTPASDLSRTCL